MKKLFIFAFVALFTFTLTFPVFADVDYNLTSNSDTFVNLLDCSSFKVTYYDSNGSILRIDPVTSRPWSVIHGFAGMEIYWSLDHPVPIETLYLAKTQRAAQVFAIYINGTNLTNYFTGTGIANQIGFTYAELPNSNLRLINNVRIVFSGLDISSTAPVGIVQFVGNILDTYSYRNTGSISTSVNAMFDNDGIFDDIYQVSGPTNTNTFEFSHLIRLPSTAPSTSWYWGQVDLVLPLSGLNSENLDYLEWNAFTYGSVLSCTAYLSDSSNPNTFGALSDVTGVEVLTNSIGSSVPVLFDREWMRDNDTCFGYQFLFNLNGIDIHEKFLHICLKINDYEYSGYGYGLAAYIESAGFNYKINYIKSGSALVRVSSYLYQIIEQGTLNSSSLSSLYDLIYNFLQNYNLPDYSAALETLISNSSVTNELLDEILLAIVGQPDYSSQIEEILSILLSVDQTIGGIKNWLDNFDGFGYDFNTSINHVYNSYETLEDQLAILETVPKTERNEYGDVLLQIGSNVNTYLAESPLYDSSYDPSSPQAITTPLTFTTPLTAFYSGNIGSMIGTLLVVVISIALIGYVLFGKRGG